MTWHTAESADYSGIASATCLYDRSRRRTQYRDILAAFDIETSAVPGTEQSGLYHWQIAIENQLIHGRDWPSLAECFRRMSEAARPARLVIYVHNLSYEWHFCRTIFQEIEPANVFAIRPRKIAKFLYDNLEFRCSYILTNLSLSAWTKRMNVEHRKLDSDAYDHTLVRYPWTELTELELQYCANDVLGLVEALRAQMTRDGDTLATIPLTATGYVRRDVKSVMRTYSQRALARMQPEVDTYLALREAFRGGDTHASRYYSGAILHDVVSYDRSSSYPDVLCNCQFPMGRWYRAEPKEFDRLLKMGTRALLFRVRLSNLRVNRFCADPPLSLSKCRKVSNYVLDNGRVMAADSLETTLTDIDWRIILDTYQFEFEVLDLWQTGYGYLPQILVQLIIYYYRQKTELKGVPGQELFYQKAKERLNSIYGLMAQDLVRLDIIYDPESKELFRAGEEDIPGKLAKATAHPYGCYAWGVWTTAWARYRLYEAVRLSGDDFVYCDTDSVKSISVPDLDAYNRERVRDSKYNGAYAVDPAGTVHYMGVFEFDGAYRQFRTWGAKKYAYTDEAGRFGITVAGVGKSAGKDELEAAGGLEAFQTGFVFKAAGGLEAVYNDRTDEDITIDGHVWHIGPNIHLKPSEYTLGLSDDYLAILRDSETMQRIKHDIYKPDESA